MTSLLLVLAALSALVYGALCCWRPPSWAGSGIKTGAVAALALAAPGLGAPPLIACGLALGALGDLCLSRPSDRAFLAGMAAFAAGHLAYGAAFLVAGIAAGGPLWPPPVLAALVLLLAASTEVWLAPRTGALRGPVRAYVAVIALMALAALGLPEGAEGARAGALLFVLSDLLLALELFVLQKAAPPQPEAARPRLLPTLLWAAYWAGQALILTGMAAFTL